jgi:hypothetical protein
MPQTLLGKVGLKFSYVGQLGSRDKRERVYQFLEPQDGLDEVFTKWQNRNIPTLPVVKAIE